MTAPNLISPFDLNGTAACDDDHQWRRKLKRDLLVAARNAGLTKDATIYEENYAKYFSALDSIDTRLNTQRYLSDTPEPSAADQWLALLLWLQESVFYSLYKLNRQRLDEFPNLAHYLRDVLSNQRFRGQLDLPGLRRGYFLESDDINPKGRIPLNNVDLDAPHDRELRFEIGDTDSGTEEDPSKRKSQGEWKRKTSGHRERISHDSSSGFRAERGRYHLYIANNCPWCHRTALTRQIKKLEDIVTMDVLYFRRDSTKGWQFNPDEPGCTTDRLFGHQYIREIYTNAGSKETSLPVLWDRETQTIVSNESAEIIRMFNDAFEELNGGTPDLYPAEIRQQIDRVNSFTYHAINNGAYKAGFADSQNAYEEAYRTFFDALETLDHMLRGRRFLLGDFLSEADVRLFPTIFRFDSVYFTRFNLSERMIREVPSLNRWRAAMLEIPEIALASDLDHCRKGYFGRNGNNIVPAGPILRP